MEKQEIYNLLEEAEKQKQTVSTVEAIKKLEEAKRLLPKLVAIDAADKKSDKNVTQNKAAQEIIYLQKRGNILYELQDYTEAHNAYMGIKKKLPNNTLVYKACGDCMRKQKKFEEALKEYERGVEVHNSDDCAVPLEKAKLLNSKGLVLIELKNYEQAFKDFSEAITITSGKNPLYYCNRGNAAYSLGKKEDGLKDFKKAQELVNANTNLDVELTSQNIDYIKKTLSQFINDLEAIGKVTLKRQDTSMLAREAYFVKTTVESMGGDNTFGDDAGSGDDQVQQIIKTKKLLADIEDDPLYEYYEAFVFKLAQSYQVAVQIEAKTFQLDINTSKEVKVLSKLLSFIPGIGSTLSDGVNAAAELVEESKIYRGAANMCKCASTPEAFNAMVQDFILEVINEREKEIKKLGQPSDKPDEVSKFQDLINRFKKLQNDIETEFYGSRNETELQKLGCDNATVLASDFIATGKYYEGATAISVRKQLKGKLVKATIDLIDKSLTEGKVKATKGNNSSSSPAKTSSSPPKQTSSPTKPTGEEPVAQAKSGCCQMF